LRFWDASAIVPLLVSEPETAKVRRLLADDAEMVVWWGTEVECASAIARLERDGALDLAPARKVLERLARAFLEVQPTAGVKAQALRLLRAHSLRAADSLQLSAAIAWCEQDSREAAFVCLDDRLRVAVETSGFRVLP
jgi:predicted nucleic acid-binding protein